MRDILLHSTVYVTAVLQKELVKSYRMSGALFFLCVVVISGSSGVASGRLC